MSVERGQRTTVRFGGVRAEVSLVKTSTKPKSAQHETKRVLVEQPAAAPASSEHPEVARSRGMVDPFGESEAAPRFAGDLPRADRDMAAAFPDPVAPVVAAEDIPAGAPVMATEDGRARTFAQPMTPDDGLRAEVEAGLHTMDTTDAAHDRQRPAELEQAEAERVADSLAKLTKPEPTEYVPPATDVQQGIHLADGTWVDLTARLREVDERTKVEGLEVVATIATNAVPRERVRDSHYVATADAKTSKVLALLWHGLRSTDAAAVVRWTKKTAQTLGIVVARGSRDRNTAHLVLLELEWSENMRPPGPRTLAPIAVDVAHEEVVAARELVEAFGARPSVLDSLRDERLAKRAELLERARAGELEAYVPPAAPVAPAEESDLAAAFAASAAALR
jgi:non-homologous end joining protein Ku